MVGGYVGYKGCNHIFIRVQSGEGNDCDNNGGYIHIIGVTKKEVDYVTSYVLRVPGTKDYDRLDNEQFDKLEALGI